MIVLDTDHMTLLAHVESAEGKQLHARLERVPPVDRATTIINFEEQTRGWLAFGASAKTLSKRVSAYAKLSRHLEIYRTMRVLEFDSFAGIEFQRLWDLRFRVGTKDLLIAAIVLAQDATLLTRNRRDFERVPGLKVEDWTTEPK